MISAQTLGEQLNASGWEGISLAVSIIFNSMVETNGLTLSIHFIQSMMKTHRIGGQRYSSH